LKKAGLPIPQPINGTFLIDTGASGTCVDPALIQPLNIPPSGSVQVQTPSTEGTPHQCDQYDVMLFIPGATQNAQGYLIEAVPILETHLASQGIDGLLGRDVLDTCTLIYNGTANGFTLCY
jgi:hypothetical protein